MNKISDDEEAIHSNDKAYIVVTKTRFAVWKFFEKNTDKNLRCVICNAKLQYHGGTALMKELLWRKHSSDNLFDTSDRKPKQRKLDIFTKNVPV